MRTVHEFAKELPVANELDVAVIGGGPAGVAAAVAASRAGASGLIERYGHLGGLATGGLVLYMDAVFDADGQRLIGGIFWDLMERLREVGGLAEETPRHLHVDSELLKWTADRICLEAGVLLRLHSWAVGVIRESDDLLGVIVESKSGRQVVLARAFVDATGDGDLAFWSGASFDLAQQRVGLNYKIGGVDGARFAEFRQEHPKELAKIDAELRKVGGASIQLGATPYSEEGVYWINVLGLGAYDGDADISLSNGLSEPGAGERIVHHFKGSLDATNVEDLSYVEPELRDRIIRSIDHYRNRVPGFAGVRLLTFASQLGVRDSRRIECLHKMSREDILEERRVEDAVGATALPFHPHRGFNMPYRSLVPNAVDGLLVSGRCVCCDNWVQQVLRLIPPAFMTGQAAGTAAALAVQNGCQPRELEYASLRAALQEDGVVFSGS